jgi:hypothetical protein
LVKELVVVVELLQLQQVVAVAVLAVLLEQGVIIVVLQMAEHMAAAHQPED